MEISLSWVADHTGSIGNGAVDGLAKEATEFGPSSNYLQPRFLRSKLLSHQATNRQHLKKGHKGLVETLQMIKSIDPTLLSAKYLQPTSGLNRSHS